MRGWVLHDNAGHVEHGESHGVQRLMEAARAKGITMEVYQADAFSVLTTHADDKTVILNGERSTLPDFVIQRTGANISYAGMALLRQFEHKGVLVCNSSKATSLSKDKLNMMQTLTQAHLPVPKTMLMQFPASIARIEKEIGFPLVIKMLSGAKGFGVHLCETPRALEEIMEIISGQIRHNPLILQEFIQDSYGRDLRVFVLADKVLGCMKRISSDGFKANYSRGGQVEAYPLTPEIEQLARATARIFELEVAGIDLLFDGNTFKICEANSAPGFKGIERVHDIDVAASIINYIVDKLSHTPEVRSTWRPEGSIFRP